MQQARRYGGRIVADVFVVEDRSPSRTVEKKETLRRPAGWSQLITESGEVVPGAKQRAYLHRRWMREVASAVLRVGVPTARRRSSRPTRTATASLTPRTVPEDIGASAGRVGPRGVAAARDDPPGHADPGLSPAPSRFRPMQSRPRVIRERASGRCDLP